MKRVVSSTSITAAKQVGDVSYFVGTLDNLYTIIKEQRIIHGKNSEYNPATKSKGFSVSFGRDILAAPLRDKDRWKYGLLLDGTKLSEHYKVVPYSYSGTMLEDNPKNFKVKYVVAYDDDTYYLNLVNWKTKQIDKQTYDWIVTQINAMPEEDQAKHKLVYQGEGKIKRNGHKIVEKYTFNNPMGDYGDIFSTAPKSLIAQFVKNRGIDEAEERIWLDATSSVNLKGAIKGVILPKTDNEEIYQPVFDLLKSESISYTVKYY